MCAILEPSLVEKSCLSISCEAAVHWYCCRYFRRLQRRYAANEGGAAAAQTPEDHAAATEDEHKGSDRQAAALDVPITCINLLRCSMQVRLRAQARKCTALA